MTNAPGKSTANVERGGVRAWLLRRSGAPPSAAAVSTVPVKASTTTPHGGQAFSAETEFMRSTLLPGCANATRLLKRIQMRGGG